MYSLSLPPGSEGIKYRKIEKHIRLIRSMRVPTIEKFRTMSISEAEAAIYFDFPLRKCTITSKEARIKGNYELKKPNHNKKTHLEILSYFSKSIAFAPQNSEELALGFNNRSVLLYHLRKYDQAIIDIDHGLACTKSAVQKAKLLCRKADCLTFVDKTEFKTIAEEARNCIEEVEDVLGEIKNRLLTSLDLLHKKESVDKKLKIKIEDIFEFESSVDLPCVKRFNNIRYDEKFDKYSLIEVNDQPEEISIIEEAYASCPTKEHTYISCSLCLSYAWNAIPCETCPCVIYCSEDCKHKAWEKYHEIECPLLSVLAGDRCTLDDEKLLLRTLATGLQEKTVNRKIVNLLSHFSEWNQKNEGFESKKFANNKFRSACNLINLLQDLPRLRVDWCKLKIQRITNLFGSMLKKEATVKVDNFEDLVLKIYGIIQTSVFKYPNHHCECEAFDKMGILLPKCEHAGFGILLAPDSSSINSMETIKDEKTIQMQH